MTKEKEVSEGGFMSSRIGKTFLVVLAGLLVFAGPTYVVYVGFHVLRKFMHTHAFDVAIVSGITLFAIGLVLMWYLVKRKIIT
jgi:hypothetical protein